MSSWAAPADVRDVSRLLDDDAAPKHLHPALIAQHAALARRQGDSDRLVERERIALIETREHDLRRARLVGLTGHDERDRLPRWDRDVGRLEALVGDVHVYVATGLR